MTPAAIAVVIVFLVVGVSLGWFSQKTYAAHGDIKVAKNRMRGGRRTRWRSAVWATVIAIATILAFTGVIHVH
jgi:hypothetical protein